MLTPRDHMTIRLATATYRYPAASETDALDQLGLSPTLFWSRVNALIDREDAIAAYPLECRRLRTLRDARRNLRASVGRAA